jgi:hypothetical protein
MTDMNTLRRAMKALAAFERIVVQHPYVPPNGNDYKVVLTNGREVTLYVQEGQNVFAVAREQGYQVQSVSKL